MENGKWISCSCQQCTKKDKQNSTNGIVLDVCHQWLFLMEITWQNPSISYSVRGAFLLLGHTAGRMAKVYISSTSG